MRTPADDLPPLDVDDLDFERVGPVRRALKRTLIHPFGNYFPASILRGVLRLLGSELARESWTDPGGWRSMVISYADRRHRLADRLLCTLGTMPMALRNRRRLAARILTRLIDAGPSESVHVLCLGAGPGHVINDAMRAASREVLATLVDTSDDACGYGRELAEASGQGHRMRFVRGDARHVRDLLDRPPDVVTMLGLCEYLSDAQVTDIGRAVADAMPPGAAVVTNSLSDAHGTDRFFRRVFGLDMIHRSPEAVAALLAPGGFTHVASVAEPLGVYHVLIGRRA
jgi:hypothetical protein